MAFHTREAELSDRALTGLGVSCERIFRSASSYDLYSGEDRRVHTYGSRVYSRMWTGVTTNLVSFQLVYSHVFRIAR